MFKRGLLLSLICLITACGFKLRGTADLPSWLNQVAVVIQNAHRDLGPMLKDQLQAYKIALASSPGDASYLLIIEEDRSQQQITSVSASTTPRQYQMFYSVKFKLIARNGKVMVPDSLVTVTRQLTVNNDRILGSDAEETTIYKEMRRDAVMQIISRLNRKQ